MSGNASPSDRLGVEYRLRALAANGQVEDFFDPRLVPRRYLCFGFSSGLGKDAAAEPATRETAQQQQHELNQFTALPIILVSPFLEGPLRVRDRADRHGAVCVGSQLRSTRR